MTYSKKLELETKTRFFVNNPTPNEAKKSLEIGNVAGGVTNGNYLKRMLTTDETREDTISYIDSLIKEGMENPEEIAAYAARRAVGKLSDIFRPMFDQTGGKAGWTAIQGSPNHDADYEYMLSEARFFYKQAPNMRVKFAATPEAMQALEQMTAEGKATLATCGFSVQYGIDALNAYKRGCEKGGGAPPFYVTMLAGHVDEYLEKYTQANGLNLSEEALRNAGCEFAKTLYRVQQERFGELDAKVLGGCRSYYHFTEMVPGDMCVTVNYDFIEMLNKMDPPIERRVDQHISEEIQQELMNNLPFFRFTVSENNRDYTHWSTLPTALYFRNYVRNGWNDALAIIRERKIMYR